MISKILSVPLVLFFAAPVLAQHDAHAMPQPKPVAAETGLGRVDHRVTTKNREAQAFFNQGLEYIYAFNHDEAVRSFKRAAELDPNLAMAYWGIALARGSNYNVTADANSLREAWDNLLIAGKLAADASPEDQAYIAALAKRYSDQPGADPKEMARDYRLAMRDLVKKYPDDLDAATLYAESMMNLRPWQLWTHDGKPAEDTLEIVSVLEGVLRRNPMHPGANHYYIHAVEASPNPERGLPSARRLGMIAPAAGHLVHMPSHIYIRTGDYAEAAKVNAAAIVADRSYMKKTGAQGLYTMMYYNHNIHFLASANSMNGRYADALRGANELASNVAPFLADMPMLEIYAAYPLTVLLRFHKWDDIDKYPAPAASMKFVAAMRHYARGVAFAEKHRTADAAAELEAFRNAAKVVQPDLQLGNNTPATILPVAEVILEGEIALSRGDKNAAVDALRKAVTADDALNYDEPPDWDVPTREWLGRALLSDGQFAEAEKVYRAELVKHPHNARALFGLAESLRKQKKSAEAAKVSREFSAAWARADTPMRVSDLYF